MKLKDDQQFLVGFGNLMKILKTMDIRFIIIKTMVLSPCVEQHLFLNNFNNIGKRYGGKFVLSSIISSEIHWKVWVTTTTQEVLLILA